MIFQLLSNNTVPAAGEAAPANSMDKSFQLVLIATGADAALAASIAAQKTATVKLQVSNHTHKDPAKVQWFDVGAAVVVTKLAGATHGTAKFPIHSEPWGYYRLVVTAQDGGTGLDAFMCMV